MKLVNLDDIDRRLLVRVQEGLPLDPEPFRRLGEELGIDAAEVLHRLEELKRCRIIRRLGGVFNTPALGRAGTLVAMKVPADRLEEVAAIVNGYDGVTHNYARDHEYNLWFTLVAGSPEELEWTIDEIKSRTGIEDILNLPTEKMYKIGVKLAI